MRDFEIEDLRCHLDYCLEEDKCIKTNTTIQGRNEQVKHCDFKCINASETCRKMIGLEIGGDSQPEPETSNSYGYGGN